MGDFFLFQELPWLRRVLAYVIGLGILWLCVSVVAFLLSPVIRRFRNTFREFLETQTSVAAAQFQTAIPFASDIRTDHNTKLRETVHLVVGSLFLIAVMTVNTGMLSQILKDLEVVPITLKFGNFQLYYVFVLLLTLVEAATGVLFDYLQQRVRRDAPATRLAPVFAVLLALGFAFVEASFYSRVGAA